jgi:hypothetical protein
MKPAIGCWAAQSELKIEATVADGFKNGLRFGLDNVMKPYFQAGRTQR